MNDCHIWDNAGSLVREIEMHEKYETFIIKTVNYFKELDWIIETLNEADKEKIKSIGYFSEMKSLNEGVADILLDLLRYADRAVFQYLVPTHKFLDDIECLLLNDTNPINIEVFVCYKGVIMGDAKKNMNLIK